MSIENGIAAFMSIVFAIFAVVAYKVTNQAPFAAFGAVCSTLCLIKALNFKFH